MTLLDSQFANLFFYFIMGLIKVVVPIMAVYIPLTAFTSQLNNALGQK